MVAWQGGDVQLGLYEYRTTYNGGDVQRSKKSQKKKGNFKKKRMDTFKEGKASLGRLETALSRCERIAEPVKDKKGKVQEN